MSNPSSDDDPVLAIFHDMIRAESHRRHHVERIWSEKERAQSHDSASSRPCSTGSTLAPSSASSVGPIHVSSKLEEASSSTSSSFSVDRDMNCESVKQYLSRDLHLIDTSVGGGDLVVNRGLRRRAAERITSVFHQLDDASVVEDSAYRMLIEQVIHELLLHRVLILLTDESERCRELSAQALSRTLQKMTIISVQEIDQILSRLEQRLELNASLAVVEESEEIRSVLASCYRMAVSRSDRELLIHDHLDHIKQSLQAMLVDKYAPVKEEGCACLSIFVQLIPVQLPLFAENLVPHLKSCLTHQHARVRCAGLKATADLLRAPKMYDVLESLCKTLHDITIDRSPLVREELLHTCTVALVEADDRYSYLQLLLPFVLYGLADDMESVQSAALSLIERIGAMTEAERPEDVDNIRRYHPEDLSSVTPEGIAFRFLAPFSCRPSIGARLIIRDQCHRVCPKILEDLDEWNVLLRTRAIRGLSMLVVLIEEYVTQHLETILPALYKCSRDDEKKIVEEVERIGFLIGQYTVPQTYLPILLPQTRTLALAVSTRSAAFLVLGYVLSGSPSSRILSALPMLLEGFLHPDALHSESDVQRQLCFCLDRLLSQIKGIVSEYSASFFRVCVGLASSSLSTIAEEGTRLIHILADSYGYGTVEDMIQRHFFDVFESQMESLELRVRLDSSKVSKLDAGAPAVALCDRESPEFQSILKLIRISGDAVAPSFDVVIPQFLLINLEFSQEAGKKEIVLDLLTSLLSSWKEVPSFSNFVEAVFTQAIIPNMAWRPGFHAGNVRRLATEAFYLLVDRSREDSTFSFDTNLLLDHVSVYLPYLMSLIDDDQVVTRLLALSLFDGILPDISSYLDDIKISDVYYECVKRMDDSDDRVRIRAAGVEGKLFRVCGDRLSMGQAENVYRVMIIHLDDANEEVKRAVEEFFSVAATLVHPQTAIRVFREVIHRQRDKAVCERLLSRFDDAVEDAPQDPHTS